MDLPHILRLILERSLIFGCFSPQDDATIKCWGQSVYGQLGLGDTSDRGDDANGPCPPSPTTAALVPTSRVLTIFFVCRDGGEPAVGRPGAWEDGRNRQRRVDAHVRSAGKATQWEISRSETVKFGNRIPHPKSQ